MSCRSTSGNPVWCGTLRGRGVPALRRENNEQDPLFLAWVGCIGMGRVVTVCPMRPGFPSPPGRFRLLEPRHASRVCRRAGGGKPEGDRVPPTRGSRVTRHLPSRPLPPSFAALGSHRFPPPPSVRLPFPLGIGPHPEAGQVPEGADCAGWGLGGVGAGGQGPAGGRSTSGCGLRGLGP